MGAEEGFGARRDTCKGRGGRTVRWVGQGLGGQLARMPRVYSQSLGGLGDNTGYLLSRPGARPWSQGWEEREGQPSPFCVFGSNMRVFKIITIYQHLKIGRFQLEKAQVSYFS